MLGYTKLLEDGAEYLRRQQDRDALAAWDAAVRAYRPLDRDAYVPARDAWWACVGVECATPAMVAFGS